MRIEDDHQDEEEEFEEEEEENVGPRNLKTAEDVGELPKTAEVLGQRDEDPLRKSLDRESAEFLGT